MAYISTKTTGNGTGDYRTDIVKKDLKTRGRKKPVARVAKKKTTKKDKK